MVNLDTGKYYSLLGTGPDVWTLVTLGVDRDAIVDWLAAVYDGQRDEIAGAVLTLLDELQREELLRPAPARVAVDAPPLPDRPRAPFVPPALAAYTDMQDLLVLDPIHDADETGWPARRP